MTESARFRAPRPGEFFWFADPGVAPGQRNRHPHLALCVGQLEGEDAVVCVLISSNIGKLKFLEENEYQFFHEGSYPALSVDCAASCRDARIYKFKLLKKRHDELGRTGYSVDSNGPVEKKILQEVAEKVLHSRNVSEEIKRAVKKRLGDIAP